MTVGDIYDITLLSSNLQSTNVIYDEYKNEWAFLQAAYDGAKELVDYGAISRHERESVVNYNRRISESYGFSYSKSIVDLFNFYLFKEKVKRDFGDLMNVKLWGMFFKNCNLEGEDFDEFLFNAGKVSSIQGHCGILVDKPRVQTDVLQQDIDKGIYPYVVLYKPLSILDWKYERDDTGRSSVNLS